jgi:signal transduction histidine kinase
MLGEALASVTHNRRVPHLPLARPTIVQRVVLALLGAFFLVWLALLAYIYIEFRQALAVDQGLKKLGRALTAALAEVKDDAEARVVMTATATQFQALRISGNPAGSVLMELRDRQGGVIHASPALGRQVLDGRQGEVIDQQIDGKTYWVYRRDTARGSLQLAEPRITGMWILERNAGRVLPYLLLAFPLILLPVWLAVKLGLRPLQRLADRIVERGTADLSPIGMDPKYAELKPLVAALERMLAQLRITMERERAFVHDAAHELRTPMAVIAAQAHALSGAGSSEERERAQAHLEQAIERASHLTQQLLELASLDDARQRLPKSVDVAQWARQILAQAAPRALARGIELTLDAPDSLEAQIDVPAFQSILENLLNNAIRYVHDGAQVVVTLHSDDERLTLSVEDDGPGIAESEHERVFERFHRGVGHDTPGSGLGLAIVKQAVSRMGGSVAVSQGLARRGVGFHVSLVPGRAR